MAPTWKVSFFIWTGLPPPNKCINFPLKNPPSSEMFSEVKNPLHYQRLHEPSSNFFWWCDDSKSKPKTKKAVHEDRSPSILVKKGLTIVVPPKCCLICSIHHICTGVQNAFWLAQWFSNEISPIISYQMNICMVNLSDFAVVWEVPNFSFRWDYFHCSKIPNMPTFNRKFSNFQYNMVYWAE